MNYISEISILMVLYDEPEEVIFRTLEEIKKFPIIIVDNKNNKKLKDKILSKFKITKYHLSNKNLGFSKGFNKAISFCKTEYAFIKGADCYIDQDNIAELYYYIKENKMCGLVSPTSHDENGNLSYNSGILPENGNTNEVLNVEGNVCVETVLGSSMFIKTEDLKKIGMFNENLFIFFSDYDLCKKIKDINKHVVQVFNSKSIHVHGISKVRNRIKRIYLREFYYTLDELIYFKNINKDKINKLESKIKNYLIKFFVCLFTLKIINLTKYYARLNAYLKFKLFY